LSDTADQPSPRATAQAIDALRRGWPVMIDDAISLLAIETADDARLAQLTQRPRRCADFGGTRGHAQARQSSRRRMRRRSGADRAHSRG